MYVCIYISWISNNITAMVFCVCKWYKPTFVVVYNKLVNKFKYSHVKSQDILLYNCIKFTLKSQHKSQVVIETGLKKREFRKIILKYTYLV